MNELFFPNLKGYRTKWLHSDVIAAIIVTAIAIPQSLGYAVIAGLPVQTGLYCAILAPIVFAAFASSRRLVVGADSATAILVASGAATIAMVGTNEYSYAVGLLGILTGAILLIMAALRFGFLADLISQTVLIGFLSGVGLQLLIGQLPIMLGLNAHGSLIDKVLFLATHITKGEFATTLISLLVIAVIVLGSKFRFPGALIALLLTILASKLFDLSTFGIDMVGTVPQGLPEFSLPHFRLDMVVPLLPAASSISIVFIKRLGRKEKELMLKIFLFDFFISWSISIFVSSFSLIRFFSYSSCPFSAGDNLDGCIVSLCCFCLKKDFNFSIFLGIGIRGANAE